MAAVVDGESEDKSPIDYEFEFDIKKGNNQWPAGGDVLSRTFTHEGDWWQLELIKTDGNGDSQSEFTCKLRLVSSTSDWKITVIYCRSGTRLRQIEKVILFTVGDQFIFRQVSLQRNDFRLYVEVLKYTEAMPNTHRIVRIPESQLSVEVRKWVESNDFGDVTIVAADGKMLRCHRDILSARSEVFDRMFKSRMENSVDIDGYDGEIIAALLAFVYVDNIDEIGPIAYRLYPAAHQYQLDRLKNLCETAMAANLSDDNAVKTLNVADLYHLDDLMGKCVEYLADHRCGWNTVPKATDSPEAKRSRPADLTGLTVISSVVGSCSYENNLPKDYKFAFAIKICRILDLEKDKVEISDSVTYNGDLWQMELKKSGFSKVRCQLRLVDTASELLKIACVELIAHSRGVSGSPDPNVTKTTRLALFQHSGDTFDFGTLTVGWNVGDSELTVQLVKWQFAESDHKHPNLQMVSHVLKWFHTEDFGDFTIVAADGKKFRCHRGILARRSEVFHSMFNAGMKEARENVVKIENFDGEVVAQLLLFIYIDDCGKIGPIADRLYAAAHQYELDRLKILCESALTARLSANSFVKSYRLATSYRLDQLKLVCGNHLGSLVCAKAVLPVADLFAEAMESQEGNEGQLE